MKPTAPAIHKSQPVHFALPSRTRTKIPDFTTPTTAGASGPALLVNNGVARNTPRVVAKEPMGQLQNLGTSRSKLAPTRIKVIYVYPHTQYVAVFGNVLYLL